MTHACVCPDVLPAVMRRHLSLRLDTRLGENVWDLKSITDVGSMHAKQSFTGLLKCVSMNKSCTLRFGAKVKI